MKKIIALFTVLAFMLNMAVAQERTKKAEKVEPKKEAKVEKAEKVNKEEKAGSVKEAKVEHPKKVEKAEVSEPAKPDMQESKAGTKKDGTPDKRYKENKEVKPEAKPAGSLKKDGTPDMRKKENKEAPKRN